jgi:hypothetical protein
MLVACIDSIAREGHLTAAFNKFNKFSSEKVKSRNHFRLLLITFMHIFMLFFGTAYHKKGPIMNNVLNQKLAT